MLARQLFYRYFLSKNSKSLIKTISKVSIFNITIGFAAFIIIISIMNGFNKSIKDRILSAEPHVVFTSNNIRNLDEDIKNKFKTKEVKSISEYSKQDVFIKSLEGLFDGAIARGYESDELGKYVKTILDTSKQSKFNNTFESIFPLNKNEVVLGSDLAFSLDVLEGDSILLLPPESLILPPGEVPLTEKVVVKGIITTEISGLDSRLLLFNKSHSLKRFRETASLELGFAVQLNDPFKYKDYLNTPSIKKAGESYVIEDWVERNSALFYALKVEKFIMGTFLSLSSLITCFSIVAIIVLLITQKAKDIKIIYSLGYTEKKIKSLFSKIAFILSLFGMGVGILVGVLVSVIIHLYPVEVLPDIYYDRTIPADVDPLMISIVILISIVISLGISRLSVKNISVNINS